MLSKNVNRFNNSFKKRANERTKRLKSYLIDSKSNAIISLRLL